MIDQILVGYDGTTASRRALLWAATHAARRSARLVVVTVVDTAPLGSCPPGRMVGWWRAAHDQAARCAAAGAMEAGAAARRLDVQAVGHVGPPGRLLTSLSRQADMVVLGVRGRGPASRPGSVARSVVMQADRPVVLVGSDSSVHPGPSRPVVVGVDGSREVLPAVEIAAVVAAALDAPLRLVCVVDTPELRIPNEIGGHLRHDPATLAEAAQTAQAAEGRVRSRVPHLRVTGVVVKGRAQAVLAREAADSGLLVVGRRGHGARRTLAVGSVSGTLMRVVRSPLAIVGWHPDATGDIQIPRLVRDRHIPPGVPGPMIPMGRAAAESIVRPQ